MSLKLCELCGNTYDSDVWDLCPFCHGHTDWSVYEVPLKPIPNAPQSLLTYHIFSEKSFIGILLDTSIGTCWVPITGQGYRYYRDKSVDHTHSLFNARWAVMKAKRDNDFIRDERFI